MSMGNGYWADYFTYKNNVFFVNSGSFLGKVVVTSTSSVRYFNKMIGDMLPNDIISTPLKRRPVALPGAPTKKGRRFSIDGVDVTPSKTPRLRLFQPVARSSIQVYKTRGLILQTAQEDLDEFSATESDCSPWSDAGSISPLSDISSITSLSPEPTKPGYFDPFTTRSILERETIELNRMICSSIVKTRSRSVFEPCHRYKNPRRPILRPRSNSLNFLVRSSRGSLEDATIYATELNAAIANTNGDGIPTINNACEKMTIPVNPAIKRRHKLFKKALLGEDYEINEAESAIPDAALIEGFEIKAVDDGQQLVDGVRQIQWADR